MNIEKIKETLMKKKISVRDLEKITKVPRGTISKILSGVTKYPRLDTICRIANALNIDMNNIVDVEVVVNDWNESKRKRESDIFPEKEATKL